MTPAEFQSALTKLGLTQGQAATFLGVSIRTVNGYANNQYPIPKATALLLRLMIVHELHIHRVEKPFGIVFVCKKTGVKTIEWYSSQPEVHKAFAAKSETHEALSYISR